jgi:hypothetical protein
MAHFYTTFGTSIVSNVEIPDFLESGPAPGDIEVTVGSLPDLPGAPEIWFESEYRTADGAPLFTIARAGDHHLFRYADGCSFTISSSGSEIHGVSLLGASLSDLFTYLTGPILGFAFRLRGIAVLHSSAVTMNGKAVLFLGHPTAGKSTTTAALVLGGARLISDNLVPLFEEGETLLARPGYPRIRLWPDSSELLFGSAEALPPITPGWEKRFFDARELFETDSRPIGAVYVLRWSEEAAVILQPVTGAEALKMLIANSYPEQFQQPAMRAAELSVFSRLASSVPIVILSRGEKVPLDELTAAIRGDVARRTTTHE